MSWARDEILARLRSRLGRPVGARVDLPSHLAEPAPRPAIGIDPLRRFVDKARAAAAIVTWLDRPEAVPAAVAASLTNQGLPPELAVGDDPWLRSLPWVAAGLGLLATGRPTTAAATRATAALAETGTLVLDGGPDNPMLLNFLPDHHFVILEAERIVSHQEEVWDLYRDRGLPRAITFVTGPSRTGDIEFTLELGAHGPRHLHVLLVAGDQPAMSP